MRKIVVGILVALVLAVAALGGCHVAARWRSSTLTPHQRWTEDMERLEKVVTEEHTALAHYIEPRLFHEAASALRRRMDSSASQAFDKARMQVALLELVALVGDPHTAADNLIKLDGVYPFYIHWFTDGPYLISGRDAHSEVLGRRVVRIGDQAIEQVVERLRAIVPHRNESGFFGSLPSYIRNPVVLHGAGIAAALDRATLTVADSTGAETDVSFSAVSEKVFNRMVDYSNVRSRHELSTPLYAEHPDRYYWFRHLPEHRTLYVRYRRAVDQKGHSGKVFWTEVLATADSLRPERFVLDVRGNPGGDNFFHLPLIAGIRARPQLNRRGALFVATDRGTFSAAITCVADLLRETEALIIGEPCADAPLTGGDARYYTLPHCRLQVGISTLLWNNTFEDDRRHAIEPDLAVDRTFADYWKGEDPVLQAIWGLGPDSLPSRKPLFADSFGPLRRAIAEAGLDEAIAWVEAAREAKPERIMLRRNNLNMEAWRAYYLDRDERAAFVLLDINRRIHPDDPFVYIRRGQMSWMTGQRLRAIGNFAWVLPISIKRYFTMKNMNDHFLPF